MGGRTSKAKSAPRRLAKPTAAEIEKVWKLRDEGLTYKEIDERMGWPQARGSRSWGIINNPRAFRPTRGPYRTRRREAEYETPADTGFGREVERPPRTEAPRRLPDRRRNGYGKRRDDKLQGAMTDAVLELLAYHLRHMCGSFRPLNPPREDSEEKPRRERY